MTPSQIPFCRTEFLISSIALAAVAAFWTASSEVVPVQKAADSSAPKEAEIPSFVMDATVPDIVADYLRDHPNPHVRIFTRRSAKNTSL